MPKTAPPCPAAQERFHANEKLAYFMLNRFTKKFKSALDLLRLEEDDLAQDARLALYNAALAYDPERGVKFSSYACQSVWNALLSTLMKARKSVNASVQLPSFERYLVQEYEEHDGLDRHEVVQQLNRLSPRCGWVLWERYMKGKTIQEIATDMGEDKRLIQVYLRTSLSLIRLNLTEQQGETA